MLMAPGSIRLPKVPEHVLQQLAQGGVPWPSLLLALVRPGAATIMFVAAAPAPTSAHASLSLTDDD